jgi:stage IV sporulation protein A
MEPYDLYHGIAQRTGGDIYIGVVGPVRTGKSIFIQRFMEHMVLPYMEEGPGKERARDETPQGGAGRTIMTTQPSFVPNEAVPVTLPGNARARCRLVDCVGYLIPGATGHMEDDEPRMVMTPWADHHMPFTEAAQIGTRKVISEHSTIGIVVTTDGSITEIPRTSYLEAEERVVAELKALDKPFIMLLNTRYPGSESALALRQALEEKYAVTVRAVDVASLDAQGIEDILMDILFEFPVSEARIDIPEWAYALPEDHWMHREIMGAARMWAGEMTRIRDVSGVIQHMPEEGRLLPPVLSDMDLGSGKVVVSLSADNSLFYQVLGEAAGLDIVDDFRLLSLVAELSQSKREYDKVAGALMDVRRTGYGLVAPDVTEMELDEPEIVRQGGRFGVRLRASAPSLHIIRADIETEVSPIVGTEKQSEELVRYLLDEFENNPAKIWETNIFGKSLHELVREGLSNKLARMPEDAQSKLQETLQRIINDSSGGLICIIL